MIEKSVILFEQNSKEYLKRNFGGNPPVCRINHFTKFCVWKTSF